MEFEEGSEEIGTDELLQRENSEPNAKKRRVGEFLEDDREASGNGTVSSIVGDFSLGVCKETQVKETLVEVSGVNGVSNENTCVNGHLHEIGENASVEGDLKGNTLSRVDLGENCCFGGDFRGSGCNGFDGEPKMEGIDCDPNLGNDEGAGNGVDKDSGNLELLSAIEEIQVVSSDLKEEFGDFRESGSNGFDGEPKMEEMDCDPKLGYDEGTHIKGADVVKDSGKVELLSVVEETQVGSSDLKEDEFGVALLGRDKINQNENGGFVGEIKEDITLVSVSTNTTECNNDESYSKLSCADDGSVLGSQGKEERRSKRRRVTFGNVKSTETVLRRSSRRTKSTFSSPNYATRVQKSSVIRNLSDEISVASVPEKCEEQSQLPPKLDLPPSSNSLILDEMPIHDIFSVYSCLRSFSTILFLSPFELEAFVAALRCDFANSLIDFVHLSILQTLKLNLEFLSDEGSKSALNCLRSLNWELLDLITWPVYMAEYLLIHGSHLKPGFELSHLKLLNGDYYKQPVAVKVEILRCLCDDLIETEVVRLELNRRTITSEIDVDIDRTSVNEMYSKRNYPTDESGGSCLTQDMVDKTTDWNSDECCLCKMDGSLICCDGCPAAYHSRCVGVVKDHLPDGDWYCPECVVDKHNPCMKSGKALRGAELLGIDPYGRLYFGTCGHLLVSDSSEIESIYYYYNKDDLEAVIDVLKTSHIHYSHIINAISMKWSKPVDAGAKCLADCHRPSMLKDLDVDGQVSNTRLSNIPILITRDGATSETINERKSRGRSVVREGSNHQNRKALRSSTRSNSTNHFMEIETASSLLSSEGSDEVSQAVSVAQMALNGADCSNKSFGASDVHEASKSTNCEATGCLVTLNSSNVEQKMDEVCIDPVHTHFEPDNYVNCYTFAQLAASVARQLTCKSSDNINEDSTRPTEEIVTEQMMAISKKWTRFCWPSSERLHKDAQKESCGWCIYCKNPTDSRDCVFNMMEKKPSAEVFGEVGSCSKRNKRSHLVAITHRILSIEERLSGLLSGPWHNPHYRKHWRRTVLKASDVASLKHPLLMLESNLSRLALSAEWLKLLDCAVTMGSASHVLTRGQLPSSKHGSCKKRAKHSYSESNSTSKSARPGVVWWRGGRLSRQLFNCNVLPHSLAFKGGRQGGCRKMPDLLYPDHMEYARRSKYIAWRAAVEMSTSVPQLALQVRELDLTIRWDDLENTQLFPELAKESRKLLRPFKKVSIRRKCIEGTEVKYLLDFGKRKSIPDAVIQHGVMLEVSASERRKYWLGESHVPLHLLKAFEEKKVARVANKMKPGLHPEEAGKLMKKTTRKRDLSHLLSKSENYTCGHCNKYVLVSEAVSCKECEGYFHKKHFRNSKGSVTSDCTYTCHKCQNEVHVKEPLETKTKKGKPLSEKKKISPSGRGRGRPRKMAKIVTKISTTGPGRLRRITKAVKKISSAEPGGQRHLATTVSHMSLRSRKLPEIKEQKQAQSKKGSSEKVLSWQKGKRTQVYHAFWLSGFRWTRKSNDARAMHFRERKLLLPPEPTDTVYKQTTCCLCCEAAYTSRLIYVGCENCKDWFHADAFGLTMENVGNVIGFRCHKCRQKNPPLCPHLVGMTVARNIYMPQLIEEKNSVGVESVRDVPDFNEPPSRDLKSKECEVDSNIGLESIQEGQNGCQ